MKKITIAIGTDHRGFFIKEYLKEHVVLGNYEVSWLDVGAYNEQRSDYPLFAIAVVELLQQKQADCGVLICGSGVGMAIAANRYHGIYAALVWNTEVAQQAKEDDNANVLVLPSDYIDNETARAMVDRWLGATFKHERYQKRIAMIDAITDKL